MRLTDRAVLAIFAVLVLAGCAAVLVPLERENTNDPVERARRGEITGLHELSMLRGENAVRAIDEIRRRSPAEVRVQSLTLRPVAAQLTVVEPANGTQRDWEVVPGIEVSGGEVENASTDYGVTFRAIDATMPERLARAVLDKLNRDPADLDYISAAISSSGDPLQWLVYLKSGRVSDRIWRADADGANLRRNGT